MRFYNFGSLNIDRIYITDHFVRPGETLACKSYNEMPGGKGLNQSIALARAGSDVYHIGKIGSDGIFLRDFLADNGVNVNNIVLSNIPTGHAIIQVDKNAENAILLHGGANRAITSEETTTLLKTLSEDDWLLLQNEINQIDKIIRYAAAKNLKIILNPAPMTVEIKTLPLDLVDWLVVNKGEGEAITNRKGSSQILDKLIEMQPHLSVILTCGSSGVYFAQQTYRFHLPAEKVIPVDTTGAGDTFIGYFFAELAKGHSIETSLGRANKAAAICVTREGAADSIPYRSEL